MYPDTDKIPISTAKKIAIEHGYQQVIIFARRIGSNGQEWVTTFGVTPTHCDAAGRIGAALGANGPLKAAEQAAAEAIRERDALRKLQPSLLPLSKNEMVEKVAKLLAPKAWKALEKADSLAQRNRRTAALRLAETLYKNGVLR